MVAESVQWRRTGVHYPMLWHMLEGAARWLLNPKVGPVEARSRVRKCGECRNITWAAMPVGSTVGGFCGPTPLRESPDGLCGCLVAVGTKGELAAWRAGTPLTIEGNPSGFPYPAGKTTVAGAKCDIGNW